MAGLLQTLYSGPTTLNDGVDKSFQTKSVGFAPDARSVQPEETVSEQLAKLLKQGSPVLDKARAEAADYSNSRGLLNSTMGAQAGESAVINAALPIAQADANAFGTAARDNQQASNAALSQTAAAGQQTSMQQLSGAQEQGIQQLRGAQASGLAGVEANYKQLMQASASASQFYTQTSKNITEILNDVHTSAEQKQSAVDKQSTMLQQAMRVFGAMADVDIAPLVGF